MPIFYNLFYALHLLSLTIFDLKIQRIPLAIIISLSILSLFGKSEFFSFIFLTISAIVMYKLKLISKGDVAVLTIISLEINTFDLSYFLSLLTIFSLLSGLFYISRSRRSFPMIPSITLSWAIYVILPSFNNVPGFTKIFGKVTCSNL